MYKLVKNIVTNKVEVVQRSTDNLFIPFNLDNTDYLEFKDDILVGGEQLFDSDGNLMTDSDAKEFVRGLP